MNILIVCIQGMTSNILAMRLNQIAVNHDEMYRFRSISYMDLKKEMPWADVVLLTPQVRNYTESIESLIEASDIQMWTIRDSALSFNNVNVTYDNIKNIINNHEQEDKTLPELIKIVSRNTFIFVAFIVVFGLVNVGLYSLFNLDVFYEVYEKTLGIVSLYGVLYAAYSFSKTKQEEPLTNLIVALATILIVSPLSSKGLLYFPSFTISKSYYLIKYFSMPWFLLYYPIVIMILIAHDAIIKKAIQRASKKHILASSTSPSIMMISITAIIPILLIIHILLYSLL